MHGYNSLSRYCCSPFLSALLRRLSVHSVESCIAGVYYRRVLLFCHLAFTTDQNSADTWEVVTATDQYACLVRTVPGAWPGGCARGYVERGGGVPAK